MDALQEETLTQGEAKALILDICERIKRSYVVYGLRITNVFRQQDKRGQLRVSKPQLRAVLANAKISRREEAVTDRHIQAIMAAMGEGEDKD